MTPCMHIFYIDSEILYSILGGIALIIGFMWDNRKDQKERRDTEDRHRREMEHAVHAVHHAVWCNEVERRLEAIESALKSGGYES